MDKRWVLLNKSELNYILENKKFSKSFEYKIKSQLKKKILLFLENEFPLLLQSGLIDINDLQEYINKNHMLPELGKEKVGNNHFILSSFCRSWIFSCLLLISNKYLD